MKSKFIRNVAKFGCCHWNSNLCKTWFASLILSFNVRLDSDGQPIPFYVSAIPRCDMRRWMPKTAERANRRLTKTNIRRQKKMFGLFIWNEKIPLGSILLLSARFHIYMYRYLFIYLLLCERLATTASSIETHPICLHINIYLFPYRIYIMAVLAIVDGHEQNVGIDADTNAGIWNDKAWDE